MPPMAPHALSPRNIEIRDNFDAIAPRYDLTNRIISCGIDRYWRRVAVRSLTHLPAEARVLDLACGTGDMAAELFRQRRAARVVGADLSRTMLRLAAEKLPGRLGPAFERLSLVNAPAEALPFKDAIFDGAVIASVQQITPDQYDRIVTRAVEAFEKWRNVPAPVRGETVRLTPGESPMVSPPFSGCWCAPC